MARIKVLIADDSSAIRASIAIKLRSADFDVAEAANGLYTLGSLMEYNPHILLLDLMMPILSGWEVCEEIRSIPGYEKLPIIVISSKCQHKDLVLASKYGISSYMAKPFCHDELITRINAALVSPDS